MRTLTKWPYSLEMRQKAIKFARQYDEMKKEADELIEQAPVMDGQPRSTKTGDPVAAAAIRRERITREIGIIEGALLDIEPEYRQGILDNVCRGVRMRMLTDASESTWTRKRRMFLVGIVKRACWIESDQDGWHQA